MRTGIGPKLARVFETADVPGRMFAMEGLRGFAVLLTFLVHYHFFFKGYLAPGSWMFRLSETGHIAGQSGVDLFFIISGYLIYGRVLRKRSPYLRFFWRRLERIYPAFACALAVYVVLHFILIPNPRIPAEGMRAAVFILESAALLPGLFEISPVFTVAWSLSYEVFFYTTIPLLVWGTSMNLWRPRARVVFLAGLAAGYAVFHLAAADWFISPLRLFPAGHPRMLMFIAGMLVYECRQSPLASRLGRRGETAAAALLATGFAGNWLLMKNGWAVKQLPTDLSRVAVLSVSLSGLVLYCLGYPGMLQQGFSWTPLRWLGNMSYSYYLTHGLALHGLRMAAGRVLPQDGASPLVFTALLPAALLLTLVPSAALFLAVEKPVSLKPPSAFRG